jgi:hypothetical protein
MIGCMLYKYKSVTQSVTHSVTQSVRQSVSRLIGRCRGNVTLYTFCRIDLPRVLAEVVADVEAAVVVAAVLEVDELHAAGRPGFMFAYMKCAAAEA